MRTETTHPKKSTVWTGTLLFLTIVLANILGACSPTPPTSQSTPPNTTTPSAVPASPTPSPLPHGTMLYQSNWTHDLKSWQPTSGWKIVDGMLQSSPTGTLSITLPYRPTTNDYALYLHMRVFTVTATTGSYLITTVPSGDQDGYQAGVIRFPRPDKETNSIHPELEIYTEPTNPSDAGTRHDLGIHYEWHDYRLEVHGAQLVFYLDDQITGRAVSAAGKFVNGPIHLDIFSIGVQISSFRVAVP